MQDEARALPAGLAIRIGSITLPRDISVRLLQRWQALSLLRTMRDMGLR